MVDHFSDLTYVRMMIITIQLESLAMKTGFERWVATFGIKIKRYHTDNGRYVEKPLRSVIEDSNQTITFCEVVSHHQNEIIERKIQTLTLGTIKWLPHAKRYWPEAIGKMLWPYALKAFSEQINVLKVDDDVITPMEKFAGTTTEIYIKNHHIWGLPVYVLDGIFKVNISVIPYWDACSHAGIYLVHSSFHSGSVALGQNPATSQVSPQFNVVFDDKFSTVLFMREDTLPPNCTYLVQQSTQSGTPDNIDLEDAWFIPDIEEDLSETKTHVLGVQLENYMVYV